MELFAELMDNSFYEAHDRLEELKNKAYTLVI